MQSKQDRPTRKRRRWKLVVLVLLLVSLCTWWYWPRIDERLVGTWTITGDGIWGHVIPMEFHRDESVEYFIYHSDELSISSLQVREWSVVGGRLIVGSPHPSIRQFDQFWEYWLDRALGRGNDLSFEIQEIGPPMLRLHHTATGLDSKYVRK